MCWLGTVLSTKPRQELPSRPSRFFFKIHLMIWGAEAPSLSPIFRSALSSPSASLLCETSLLEGSV